MHPINNTNFFKAFIFNSSIIKIFIGFIALYFLVSILFSIIYFLVIDSASVSFINIIKYSILSSFNFTTDMKITNNGIFLVVKFLHQITALILSTIFTAAIVLKFFYLPTFFVFKKKCNYLEKSDELIITLYNSIDIFVTNCHVRVYGREEDTDEYGAKSLQNINNNQPIFEKTYPFMEMYLATRLKIKFIEGDTLWQWFKNKDQNNKKLDLIILVEANAVKIDSPIYEVYKYSIDSKDINKTVDSYEPHSIDLNYDDFSKSKGWDEFEK
jgi:hypothetical protein